MATKYGDISNYAKEIAAEKEQQQISDEAQEKEAGIKAVPGIKAVGGIQKEESANKRDVDSITLDEKLPIVWEIGGERILEQQVVKKTVEIKLIYDLAIESVKATRKKKNRFQKHDLPMTNNAIMNEILDFYFAQDSNRQHLEDARKELTDI